VKKIGPATLQKQAVDQIRNVVAKTRTRAEQAKRAAEIIRAAANYRWVGIYDVMDDTIAAVGWTGIEPPAYPVFPVAQGLCGAAVSSRAAVLVGDVTKDARDLTAFGCARWEMVVPAAGANGEILGLIDVESARVNAFNKADAGFVGECALALVGFWRG